MISTKENTQKKKKGYPLYKGKCEYFGRPDVDYGVSLYFRLLNLRTFDEIVNHDYTIKALINRSIYNWVTRCNKVTPSYEEFKERYSDYFEFESEKEFQSCPGQQSLESVMEESEEIENPAEPEKPKKEENPGSVYGDTPNNIKQQPITFADIFNKTAQPLEIEGKKYQPRLELIDADTNSN